VLIGGVKEAAESVIKAICGNESGMVQEKEPDLSLRLHSETTRF
jgi:hypothetical protein